MPYSVNPLKGFAGIMFWNFLLHSCSQGRGRPLFRRRPTTWCPVPEIADQPTDVRQYTCYFGDRTLEAAPPPRFSGRPASRATPSSNSIDSGRILLFGGASAFTFAGILPLAAVITRLAAPLAFTFVLAFAPVLALFRVGHGLQGDAGFGTGCARGIGPHGE